MWNRLAHRARTISIFMMRLDPQKTVDTIGWYEEYDGVEAGFGPVVHTPRPGDFLITTEAL